MTRLRVAMLVALSIQTTTVVAMQQQSSRDATWADIHHYWKQANEEAGIVGSSIAILKDGAVVHVDRYGLADLASARPVDEQTIFHWASITKTFTGIAIMQLRDRGLLDLDDPIVNYIPEFNQVHNPFGETSAITLRRLMSHASGLRDPTWPWGGETWHPHEPTEWSQLVAMFPYTEIQFEPGSKYSYSNPGVILLGRVIELLTGEDYEVYVEKNVLRPLGMHASYFDHTPYHLLGRRSNNYFVSDGEIQANGLDFDTGITVSNGGLNAPVPDMVNYLAFLSGHFDTTNAWGDGASDAGTVLSRSSLQEMWRIQQPISSDDDGTWSMGLSFFLWDEAGEHVVGHTGSQQGFRSFFYVNPRTGAAAMVVFNTIVRIRQPDGSLEADDTGFLALRRRVLRELFPMLEED